MGVTIQQLCERYPLLYHMAWAGSWPTIEQHGLLSTSALLDLYGVEGVQRTAIESTHRPRSVTIASQKMPSIVIRDQHPMSEKSLKRVLTGGLTPQQWYKLLNARVFFWLTKDRLNRMLSSPPYAQLGHTVMILDTALVARDHWNVVRLSPMNTGCTVPYAHPRGLQTLMKPEDYPWESRRRRGDDAVVEFTIEGGLRNVRDYLVDVQHRHNKMADQLPLIEVAH